MKITRVERARFQNEDLENRPSMWLVGITDLTTLLLTFFILLFSTTQSQTTPVLQAAESFRTRFSGTEQSTQTNQQAGHTEAKMNWESQERNPGLQLSYLYSLIRKYTVSTPDLKQIIVWQDTDSIVLTFPTELCFNPGESTLSDYGKRAVGHVANLLGKLPNTIQIVGHADSTPVDSDGQYNSNWHLSLARAYTVTQALQDEGYTLKIETRGRGTADADVLPQGLIEELPRNATQAQHREKARRVDIHVSLLKS